MGRYIRLANRLLRRGARAAGRAIKRRYVHKKGGLKIKQIVKDVSMLKSMVNAEKKRYDIAGETPLGQLNGATGQGLFVTDLTPVPQEGVTSTTRTGNSIRLHSAFFKAQFWHMASTTAPITGQLIFMRVWGPPVSNLTTFVNQIFNLNPFVLNAGSPAIVDLNSDQNPDYMRQYKIIKRKRFHIPIDSYAGVNVIKTISVGLKFPKWHVRYQTDGGAVPTEGQLLMIALVDSGNISGTTASTLSNVPVSGTSTGLNFAYNMYEYYYDN